MTIIVKIDTRAGQRQGDWVVKNGAGRGGTIVSRHRLKRVAVSRGRVEARKRGAVLKVQLAQTGQFRTVANYG